MNCRFCGKILRSDNIKGACHYWVRRKGLCAPERKCLVCNKSLSRKNKGDACRLHRTSSTYYKTYQKEFRAENQQSISEYKREYRAKNLEEYNKYFTDRTKADIQFRLGHNLRSRIGRLLRAGKAGSTVRDLGCSLEQLKLHLEQQFKPGMTWDNYGLHGWHIDHILPLSKFDLADREQFLKACNYTNLQPMWATDNIRKGNRT